MKTAKMKSTTKYNELNIHLLDNHEEILIDDELYICLGFFYGVHNKILKKDYKRIFLLSPTFYEVNYYNTKITILNSDEDSFLFFTKTINDFKSKLYSNPPDFHVAKASFFLMLKKLKDKDNFIFYLKSKHSFHNFWCKSLLTIQTEMESYYDTIIDGDW